MDRKSLSKLNRIFLTVTLSFLLCDPLARASEGNVGWLSVSVGTGGVPLPQFVRFQLQATWREFLRLGVGSGTGIQYGPDKVNAYSSSLDLLPFPSRRFQPVLGLDADYLTIPANLDPLVANYQAWVGGNMAVRGLKKGMDYGYHLRLHYRVLDQIRFEGGWGFAVDRAHGGVLYFGVQIFLL